MTNSSIVHRYDMKVSKRTTFDSAWKRALAKDTSVLNRRFDSSSFRVHCALLAVERRLRTFIMSTSYHVMHSYWFVFHRKWATRVEPE